MLKIIFSLILSAFVYAHGSKTKTVDDSVSMALTKFEAEQDSSIVDTFSGVKSWLSGSKVRVKIYYQMHQNHLLYTCESVHNNGQDILQCTQD